MHNIWRPKNIFCDVTLLADMIENLIESNCEKKMWTQYLLFFQ